MTKLTKDEVKVFQGLVAECFVDSEARLVLADWLEEKGRVGLPMSLRGDGYRTVLDWLAREVFDIRPDDYLRQLMQMVTCPPPVKPTGFQFMLQARQPVIDSRVLIMTPTY